jgi:hypothetical protein
MATAAFLFNCLSRVDPLARMLSCRAKRQPVEPPNANVRRILYCNVTKHPTSAWVSQQLREAFPYDAVHDPIPNEEVLAEFGLSPEDFERMGRTPLEPEPQHPSR